MEPSCGRRTDDPMVCRIFIKVIVIILLFARIEKPNPLAAITEFGQMSFFVMLLKWVATIKLS